MGTSRFAIPTLKMLLESDWRLLGVVTRPDRPQGRGRRITPSPVKQFVADYRLPVYQPETAGELAALLMCGEIKPAVIIVVAYGQLLPPEVLELPQQGCVNLHPSLLPAYRGAAPIQRVIINGETGTAVTTMYLNSKMDAGDLILQEEVEIPAGATSGELADLLAVRGAALVSKTLNLIVRGAAPRHPQDDSRATYAPPLRREEAKLDWTMGAQELSNLIRGLNPNPGAYTLCRGKIVKVWLADPLTGKAGDQAPGDIVTADPRTGLVVQTGSGQLLIREVQPAGRAHMSGAAFVRGYKMHAGFRLGE